MDIHGQIMCNSVEYDDLEAEIESSRNVFILEVIRTWLFNTFFYSCLRSL